MPALLKEWAMRLPQLQGKRIVSIYFGGGTPTKLAPADYAHLLQIIRSSGLDIAADCEITLEANPEDVDLPLMRAFALLGINRVSLGVQSLLDEDLIVLGRTHTANCSLSAISAVRAAGISNISIDLMFELPRQGVSTWKKVLNALHAVPVTHLSLYNLTYEPHTFFFKKRAHHAPLLPSEEERLQMLQMAVQAFEEMGFARYEISAFAKPGAESRHNKGYWTGRPFLGFGPSAFSHWEGARFSNVAHFNHYLTSLEQGKLPTGFTEQLAYPSNLQELLAVRLRLVEGVDLVPFAVTYGAMPEAVEVALHKLVDKGWIHKEGTRIRLTAAGQLFYDSVAAEII